MKTTSFILAALLFSTGVMIAQNSAKPTTVRIKKIENINGVEKTTDTTYTVNGPVNLQTGTGLNGIETDGKKDGKSKKIVIVTNEVNGEVPNSTTVTSEDVMDEQVQSALNAAGVDGKDLAVDRMIMVNVDDNTNGTNTEKKSKKVLIIKTIKIIDPTMEDSKALGNQKGDGKLEVDYMNFYPNPSNGKFNLAFNLPKKGDAEVNIMNTEGTSIYSDKLPAFSGNYNKEIDISQNPKGIYFVKVTQGGHSQIKKVILE